MKTVKYILPIMIVALFILDLPTHAQPETTPLREGFRKERAGDLDGAIQVYEEIIANTQAKRRQIVRAHYRLGKCYLRKGDKDKAAEHFKRLVSEFPKQRTIVKKAIKELRRIELGRFERPPGKGKEVSAQGPPKVVSTAPSAFADDVLPDLRQISVTFDQPMKNKSWSWVQFDKSTFPKTAGQPHYDMTRKTCTLPVRLKPGKAYLVGINCRNAKNFKSASGKKAEPYALVFATKDATGKPTPIPEEMIATAKAINSGTKPAGDKGIEGIWLGVLKIIVKLDLRVAFKISKKPDGTLMATLDSPDQGVKDIPVDRVSFENGRLSLEAKTIQATFEGKMNEDGLAIEGLWRQAGSSWPLVLKRVDEVPKLHWPQEPKKPYPYNEKEVVYENKKDGVKLAGTLTFPRSKGPFPAVLLITGSGLQDRDESLMGHKPFLVLADHLTRRGLAVLRVDDRGIGGSTGNVFEATSEDLARDVLAGVEYLRSRKKINPKQIGLIGHSEGGLIAPMVAIQSLDVAFVVLMASPGLTIEEILYLQADLVLKVLGASDKVIDLVHTQQEQIFPVLKQEKDRAVAEKKIRAIMKETEAAEAELSEQEREWLDSFGDTTELSVRLLLSPWFRQLLTHDPKPTLRKLKCPVLAIIGEKDLQIAPKENLQAIEQALKAGGNTNYTVKELPNLNHLFQTAETGSPTEYGKIEETFSPTALRVIGEWIAQTVGIEYVGGEEGIILPDTAFVIEPLVGMGEVRFGMTIEQVKGIFGEPQRMTGRACEYLDYGFAIVPGRDGTVYSIMCGDAGVPDSPLIKKCRCRTDKGIGMGSNMLDIMSAYGRPSSTKRQPGNVVELKYNWINSQLSLRDNKVVHMMFTKPKKSQQETPQDLSKPAKSSME